MTENVITAYKGAREGILYQFMRATLNENDTSRRLLVLCCTACALTGATLAVRGDTAPNARFNLPVVDTPVVGAGLGGMSSYTARLIMSGHFSTDRAPRLY